MNARVFGLLVILFVVEVIYLPAGADIYVGPLTAIDTCKVRTDADVAALTKYYKGPALSNLGFRSLQPVVEFTLYPDGSVRWLRMPKWSSSKSQKVDSSVYNSLCEALRSCAPLQLGVVASLKKPRTCLVAVEPTSEGPIFDFTFTHPVLFGKYTIEQGGPATEKAQWLSSNLARILSFMPVSKILQIGNDNRPCAVWFRLNPDGSIDDCQPVHEAGLSGKLKQNDKPICDLMSKAIRQAGPLTYVELPGRPQAPRGLLLVFDSYLQSHFKLSPVDYDSADVCLSSHPRN